MTPNTSKAKQDLRTQIKKVACGFVYQDFYVSPGVKQRDETWSFKLDTLEDFIKDHEAKTLRKLAFHTGYEYEELVKFTESTDEVATIFDMKIKTDRKVPKGSVRFDHPDGRSEGYKLEEE
jgi:hypothetical protein